MLLMMFEVTKAQTATELPSGHSDLSSRLQGPFLCCASCYEPRQQQERDKQYSAILKPK